MSKINLLPEEYVKQRLQYRVDMLCVLLFGMVMISIMTAEAISSRKVQQVQTTHARLDARYQEVATFVKEFFVLQRDKKDLFKEAAIIEEMTDRIPRSYLLAMITNNCPDDITLTMIDIQENFIVEQTPDQPANQRRRVSEDKKDKQEEIKPPRIQLSIVIKGLATDIDLVTLMMQNYRGNPLVESSRLTETRENRTAAGKLHEFNVVIVLKETDEVLKVMKYPEKLQQLVAYQAGDTQRIEFQPVGDSLADQAVIEDVSQTTEVQP